MFTVSTELHDIQMVTYTIFQNGIICRLCMGQKLTFAIKFEIVESYVSENC